MSTAWTSKKPLKVLLEKEFGKCYEVTTFQKAYENELKMEWLEGGASGSAGQQSVGWILFYSIPFHSIPFYSILFCSVLFYSILFSSILF